MTHYKPHIQIQVDLATTALFSKCLYSLQYFFCQIIIQNPSILLRKSFKRLHPSLAELGTPGLLHGLPSACSTYPQLLCPAPLSSSLLKVDRVFISPKISMDCRYNRMLASFLCLGKLYIFNQRTDLEIFFSCMTITIKWKGTMLQI